jgi:hypothetical protein
LFLAQNVYKRIAIVILQHGKIEISRFRFDDMLRELHHLGGNFMSGMPLKYYRTSCVKRSVTPHSPLHIGATSIGRSRAPLTTAR